MLNTLKTTETFFFGNPGSPLYGSYESPSASVRRDCGIVLCYPLMAEYLRSHRAFRQLAVRLAEAGFPVLRFDYFGSGDSAMWWLGGLLPDAPRGSMEM